MNILLAARRMNSPTDLNIMRYFSIPAPKIYKNQDFSKTFQNIKKSRPHFLNHEKTQENQDWWTPRTRDGGGGALPKLCIPMYLKSQTCDMRIETYTYIIDTITNQVTWLIYILYTKNRFLLMLSKKKTNHILVIVSSL